MAYNFPVMMKYCTCTDSTGSLTPLGHRQQEYEDLLHQNLKPVEALERMGVRRMCCRNAFLNPPYIFLIDSNTGRFTDTTGLLNQNVGNGDFLIHRETVMIDGPTIDVKIPLPDIPSPS